jgi:hypothetical protein
MINLSRFWGMDIETYPNIFTCSLTHLPTMEERIYEISDRIDESAKLHEMLWWMSSSGQVMVGFNSIGFDYPVLHLFMEKPNCGYHQLYLKAQSIIDATDDRFSHIIWPDNRFIDQIDLFKIHHFDNISRSTSLKMLEFCMGSHDIKELPYTPGTELTHPEKNELRRYNSEYDVRETIKFFYRSLPQIQFRADITEKYGKDFMNHNDTKIGKDYFIMELERLIPGSCYSKIGGRRVMNQTPRYSIDLSECIFPYITFKHPEFNRILNHLKNQTITETKGVFKKLNCIVDGFQYDFGTGGIHGSVESSTVHADEDNCVIDADVASYYPNLAIVNGLFPEHLGNEFCDIYLDVYNQRKGFPKNTHPAENAMLKLALNGGIYGGSNNKYSPFYDPKYTMSITLNGQLLLCMLAEQLSVIPGLKMVQINTDGLTVKFPRTHQLWYYEICDEWQKFTKLDLEYVNYSRMFIRDVNSYIAEDADSGKLKRIGAYEWKKVEDGGRLGYHQDRSQIVVSKAAEAALIHGMSIPAYVKNHQNDMDFMLRTKVPRASKLMFRNNDGTEERLQNITRYTVSEHGGFIHKLSPPTGIYGTWKRASKVADRDWFMIMDEIKDNPTNSPDVDSEGTPHDVRIHTKNRSKHAIRQEDIKSGWKILECNNMDNFDRSLINYDYYINEVKKLVEPLVNGRSV